MGFITKQTDKLKEKAEQELTKLLPPDERVEQVFIAKEDYCAITPKRIVFIDKKLISSKKTIVSIPYSKINFIALKRGGFFSVSKEVIIGASGHSMEIDTWSEEDAFEIVKVVSTRIG